MVLKVTMTAYGSKDMINGSHFWISESMHTYVDIRVCKVQGSFVFAEIKHISQQHFVKTRANHVSVVSSISWVYCLIPVKLKLQTS